MKTLVWLLPHGGPIGQIMEIESIGIDRMLAVPHIVAVDQAGISPAGQMTVIMIIMKVVTRPTKSQGLSRHQQCRLLMKRDSVPLASFGLRTDALGAIASTLMPSWIKLFQRFRKLECLNTFSKMSQRLLNQQKILVSVNGVMPFWFKRCSF